MAQAGLSQAGGAGVTTGLTIVQDRDDDGIASEGDQASSDEFLPHTIEYGAQPVQPF